MPSDLWTLRGNLGKDVVVKSTANGTTVANFSVARSNGKDKPPTWFNVQAWKETGESCRMLKKGDSVCCVGFMKSREWEKKIYWEFNAWDVYINVMTIREAVKNDTSTTQEQAPPPPSDSDLPF